MNTETILAAGTGLGALVATGVLFLTLGEKMSKRRGMRSSPIGATLHLVAAAAAVLGGVLAWMAFESDHPMKWRHLALPAVFVAIVYGYALRSGLSIRSQDKHGPEQP